MANSVLEIIDFSQNREVSRISRIGYLDNLAVGDTTSRLTLMSPSGRYWIIVVPNEMLEDLQTGLDVRDHVVASGDKDAATPKEG